MSLAARAQIFNEQHPGQQLTAKDLGKFMRQRGIKKKRVRLFKRNPRRMGGDAWWQRKHAIAHELMKLNERGFKIWQMDECAFKSFDHQRYAWSNPCQNVTLPHDPGMVSYGTVIGASSS